MPPPDEPDGSGTGGFNSPSPIGAAGFDLRLEGIDSVATSVATLTGNLDGLRMALGKFSTGTGNSLNSLLREIKKTADEATRSIGSLTGAASGSGGTGTGSGSGSSSWAGQATAQASASSRMTGGIAAASTYLTGFSNPLVGAGMGTLRFLRDRIGTNRNTAIEAGSQWGMTSRQQGASIQEMMATAGRFPGGIYGTPQDLLGMFGAAPSMGASFAFGGGTTGSNGLGYGGQTGPGGRQGVRAAGMFAGIREAQMLNPGASVGQIMSDIGSFSMNTGAQQQSQMMTGGAFSMISAGGRQKSLSEWAESVLKWLQDLRGAPNRGKEFKYGELMAQYFPGSNIDAWFQANGVPPNMRTYWWTYALAKAGSTDPGGFKITPDETNVAWQRMRATSELTRTEFNLGSAMTGAYLNKEQANKWFNQMFGQAQTSIIPSLAGSGAMSWIQYLPDSVEDMLMSAVEGIAQSSNKGDVGDMYTDTGGTGLAGLSPNMRSKLGPMLRVNPRVSVTSGLRDNAMQSRLKGRGFSRVSGKPSAHTRGDAADLGPPSEYGWIMKNAKKFGLKSGKSQGEPWHVGVGDPLDDLFSGEDSLGLFSSTLRSLGGSDLGTDSGSMATFMAKFMKFLLGSMTGMVGAVGGAAPQYDPNLFDNLVKASKGSKIGGTPSAIPFKTVAAGPGAPLSAHPDAPGGSVESTGAYRGFRTSSTELAQFASGIEIERGAATARALYAAGFRGEELINMTSIAYRESHWSPQAWNGVGKDRSGGLLQVNQKPYFDAKMMPPYGVEDMFDPYANAQIAYDMFTRNPEGKARLGAGPSHYDPWTVPGGTWQTDVNFTKGRDAVAAAGVGDVDTGFGQLGHAQMIPSLSRGGSLMQFNNTFHINGGNGAGGGGIDTRRTVTLLANQLEDEMNRRLSRAN